MRNGYASTKMDHPVATGDDVPDRPSSKFTYTITNNNNKYATATWTGAMSDAEERVLREWADRISPESLKDAFVEAIGRLVDQLDRTSIAKRLRPLRPKQDKLDDAITRQLTIEPDKLSWNGRVHAVGQLQELGDLATKGDASFDKAVAAIVERLENEQVTQPFDSPIQVRPTTASITGALHGRLLVGTAALEYEGIMSRDEAESHLNALSQPADKKAVEQLYRQTVRHGLRDNGLQIAARRGSARVSKMRAIPIQDLAADGPSAKSDQGRSVSDGQGQQPT